MLIQTLHDHINRIVVTKTPDNQTTPSPHTRTMVSKLQVMEHVVEQMAVNVSSDSHTLQDEKKKLDQVNSMESKASATTNKVNTKMNKAAAQYANASAALDVAMANAVPVRQTYEEAKVVDAAERKMKMLQLQADVVNKKIELKLEQANYIETNASVCQCSSLQQRYIQMENR